MYIVQKKQFVFTLMFVKIWWRAKQFSWFCPCFLSLSSSVSTYVYNMPWGINMCLIRSNWWQFLYYLPWNVWSGNGPRCLCWPFSPNQQEQCWAPCCVACLGCRWGHRLESSHRFQHYRRWVGCPHSGWPRFHLSSLPGRWRRLRHTGSRNWLGPRYLLLKPCPSGISQETLLGWCPGRPLGRPRTACGHVWQGHCSTCACPCEPKREGDHEKDENFWCLPTCPQEVHIDDAMEQIMVMLDSKLKWLHTLCAAQGVKLFELSVLWEEPAWCKHPILARLILVV